MYLYQNASDIAFENEAKKIIAFEFNTQYIIHA